MKKSLSILLTFLLLLQLLSAQKSYPEHDTVFVKYDQGDQAFEVDTMFLDFGKSYPQLLVGTRMLPSSPRWIKLINQGLTALNLEIAEECDKNSIPPNPRDYPKFQLISRRSDSLVIDVAISANCCYNFLGEAEIIRGDTLNLIYHSYGGFCSCNCCYTLRYTFRVQDWENQKLKFVTVNGGRLMGKIPEE